jgi:hypothetical protein
MARLLVTLLTVVMVVDGTTNNNNSNSHHNGEFTFHVPCCRLFVVVIDLHAGVLTSPVGNIHPNIPIAATTVPMDTNHISRIIRLPIHQAVLLLNNIPKVLPSGEIIGEGLAASEEGNNSLLAEAGDFAADLRMPSGMPTQAVAGLSNPNLYQVY